MREYESGAATGREGRALNTTAHVVSKAYYRVAFFQRGCIVHFGTGQQGFSLVCDCEPTSAFVWQPIRVVLYPRFASTKAALWAA